MLADTLVVAAGIVIVVATADVIIVVVVVPDAVVPEKVKVSPAVWLSSAELAASRPVKIARNKERNFELLLVGRQASKQPTNSHQLSIARRV